jgi:hypothetical protein
METFQNVIDVIEHSGGTVGNEPGIVEGIAAHQGLDMATVDSDQEAALNQAARQHYLAVAFIFNSDRNRFGRLLENLENDFLLGDDNYPKTVTSAYNLLTNFKEDQRNMLRGPSNDGVSFNTIGEEEESAVEPAVVLATNGAAKNQNEFPHITCHRCDKKGHYASACAEERQTSTQMLMAGVNSGEFDSSPTGESFMFHTRGEVKHTSVTLNIKQNGPVSSSWILLDNQSTVDVFHNGNLLENIRPADGHMDIHCNAGVTSTNLVGDLPGYGEVWYHPGGIANILSLSRVKNRGHRVIYDSHDGNEFRVSRKNGTTRVFKESSRGLYFMDTNTDETGTVLVNTVEGNKSNFSNADYSRAVLARQIQKTIGRPSNRTFIDIVEKNLLVNCPITRRDIDAAEQIFGPDIGSLKGKTVRRVGSRVITHLVDIPATIMNHYKKVTLAGDIMFVNKLPFFMTVSRHLRFGTAENITNQTKKTLLASIKQVKSTYLKRGFILTDLLMDGQFEPLRADLADMQLNLNTVS